jgi:hypothetical protein
MRLLTRGRGGGLFFTSLTGINRYAQQNLERFLILHTNSRMFSSSYKNGLQRLRRFHAISLILVHSSSELFSQSVQAQE